METIYISMVGPSLCKGRYIFALVSSHSFVFFLLNSTLCCSRIPLTLWSNLSIFSSILPSFLSPVPTTNFLLSLIYLFSSFPLSEISIFYRFSFHHSCFIPCNDSFSLVIYFSAGSLFLPVSSLLLIFLSIFIVASLLFCFCMCFQSYIPFAFVISVPPPFSISLFFLSLLLNVYVSLIIII